MMNVARDVRTLYMHPLFAIVAAGGLAVLTSSGRPPRDEPPDTRYGTSMALGDGTARSYVTVDARGVPTAIGIALSENVMTGLQDGHGHHEQVLTFPEEISATPFRHATLHWNPSGHEPVGVYDLPHFDFHFYTIADEARRMMTPEDPQFEAKAALAPDREYVPAGYISPPGLVVPLMGNHWVDPTSPELNGSRFTETLIYGSYDGEVVFVEPMITRAWLAGRPDFTEQLKLPERYPSAGLWPTVWSVRFDEETKEYRIELAGLTRREAN